MMIRPARCVAVQQPKRRHVRRRLEAASNSPRGSAAASAAEHPNLGVNWAELDWYTPWGRVARGRQTLRTCHGVSPQSAICLEKAFGSAAS